MVTVEEKLRALYKLQLIDTEVDKIRIVRGELPLEIDDLEDLIAGLNLVGDFLKKSIFIPNNINFPNSRIDFLNSIDLN